MIDAEQARVLVEMKRRVLETGEPDRIENVVEFGGKPFYFETAIVRRVGADGKVIGLAGYCRDVTQRKIAEQALRDVNASLEQRVAERTESLRVSEARSRQIADHNRLLVQEVEHRVGNNLAGLLGLVNVMRSRTNDVKAFADAIESRLLAMAHVHQMLRQTGWTAIVLRDLIESALNALRATASYPTEEHLEGPRVEVAAKYVQALTLILLELYTNSCKYGAHSCPGGKLSVAWSIETGDGGAKIRLIWRERGGPPITGPVKPSTWHRWPGQTLRRQGTQWPLRAGLSTARRRAPDRVSGSRKLRGRPAIFFEIC